MNTHKSKVKAPVCVIEGCGQEASWSMPYDDSTNRAIIFPDNAICTDCFVMLLRFETSDGLAGFVESTIKFRIDGMTEAISNHDEIHTEQLRIRIDEDYAILAVLRSFKGWKEEAAGEEKA